MGAEEHHDQAVGTDVARKRLWRGSMFPWLAVFALALALRFAYTIQIRQIPFFEMLIGDAAAYDEWAGRIAGGDWCGEEAFYQAPAYPYFLAIIYRLAGRNMLLIRVVQAFLGAGACVLLGLAGQRFFSRPVGIASAVLLAIYPPAIFFCGLVQKTTLGLFLLAALLWRLAGLQVRPRSADWLLAGVLVGLFGLTRENALVIVVVLFGWIWSAFFRHDVRARVVWSIALAAGLTIILGPVAYRNHRLGGGWAVTTVQAGPNFYIGNHPHATGRYMPLVPGREIPPFEREDAKHLAEQAAGKALTDIQVSRFWLGKSFDYIRSEPFDWLMLMGKKMLLVINAYEITDTEGYGLYRDFSWLLGVLGSIVHFGVVAPLAAAGVALTWGSRRRLGVLYAVGVALALSVAAFYVFARYRFPFVAIVILFAAAGLVEGARLLRSAGQREGLAMPALLLIGATILCNLRMNPERQLDAIPYANLAGVLAGRGDLEAAGGVLQIALEECPESPELRYNLGLLQRVTGNPRSAVENLKLAKSLDPQLVEVDFQLGVACEAVGEFEAALKHYRDALRVDAADSDAAAAIERIESRAQREAPDDG